MTIKAWPLNSVFYNVPQKYVVSEIIDYIKGKSAIARQFRARKRNFSGESFWARSYAVSTVGFKLEKIRAYMQNQDQLDGQGSNEDGSFYNLDNKN